jgi:hypothetical protein
MILEKQYFTAFLQVQPQIVVELAGDNKDRKLTAYPLLCYCSSRSFFLHSFLFIVHNNNSGNNYCYTTNNN